MFAISCVCHAFNHDAVGTKVNDPGLFDRLLAQELQIYQFPANGQGFVTLPEAVPLVSCGVARRRDIPLSGYVVRAWRGEVDLFASRRYAAKADSVHVVVYKGDVYRADPQVSAEEAERVRDAAYVIVAVLATVGPKPPLSSHRFVRNLAGGNQKYSIESGYSLEAAIEEARQIVEYEKDWITVSD
jgi:hypothetical protein